MRWIKITWEKLTNKRFDLRKIKVGEIADLEIEEIPNRRPLFAVVSRVRDEDGNNTLRFHKVEKNPVNFSLSLPYPTKEEVDHLYSLTVRSPGRHDGWGSLSRSMTRRSASQIINELENRIARLEKQAKQVQFSRRELEEVFKKYAVDNGYSVIGTVPKNEIRRVVPILREAIIEYAGFITDEGASNNGYVIVSGGDWHW